ncbi:MAG: FIST C-terminal domain-containing protein [Polaromonas sp.]|jgi:small ligand-binding sensory domain FIST|uniref:FIST signal transduction protein n=1 Tax=Polaromonas sp. TaxID=1869339 RepID=UPI0027318684|nr:FIST N-terminal domain-containing protein [Polaromonas sp.]MDP2257876.1 FIST C-terminal domain-containing protein [Polaromonas sp.]MDP3709254.1 FIST C-terminal domain-containing protein [Polaromonas sp.]
MKLFPYGHATHPQWQMAAGLVLAQLRARLATPGYADSPTLALLYITDHYATDAQEILDHLSAELPDITDWSGTVGVGIAANNVEYFDEPALAVMLCELPHDQYRVFSGVSPLPPASSGLFKAHTALVHADAATPDVAELIDEMAQRTESGYVFGGLASSRSRAVQFALSGHGNVKGQGAAGGVFSGGLSGVAFARDPSGAMALMSRVTQGCRPISAEHEITACDANVVTGLDGQPALDVMLADLGVSLEQPREALAKVRMTLVGLSPSLDRLSDARVRYAGQFGADVLVRHLIGLDPARKGIAIAEVPTPGMKLAFCERNAEAARADLVRVCAEIREELEPQEATREVVSALNAPDAESAPHAARRIAGAIYVSCSGRGGPHFGAPSAELQIVRRALGDVPLVGFFAGGEIARNHLYGYTGVLTVFTAGD